jgi:hypothetical protein
MEPQHEFTFPLSPSPCSYARRGKILAVNELLLGRNVRAAEVHNKLEQRIEWKGYERVVRV